MYFKKSQISIFLVIVVIIILILIFFISQNSEEGKNELKIGDIKSSFDEIDSNIDGVKDYVDLCLRKTSRNAIYLISNNGGYISSIGNIEYDDLGDKNAFFNQAYFNGFVYPYVYNGEEKNLRNLNLIEEVVKKYTFKNFNLCINNFSFYNGTGINIEYENLSFNNFDFDFNDENTMIELNWKINIESLDKKVELSMFNLVYEDLKFKKLYDIVDEIIDDIKLNDDEFDINPSCSNYLGSNEKINIYLNSNRYNYDYLLSIIDSNPSPYDVPLKFNVGIKNVKLSGGCYGF